jgi:thioredoxin reductase (NADPH)
LQTAKKTEYDIIIIGGGPIGIACGLEAEKHNLSYLILEKGCLVNSLYHYPTNMTFFSTSDKLELDNIPFISNNPKPRKAEALEYYRRIATSNKLNINLFEKVLGVKLQRKKSIPYKLKNPPTAPEMSLLRPGFTTFLITLTSRERIFQRWRIITMTRISTLLKKLWW